MLPSNVTIIIKGCMITQQAPTGSVPLSFEVRRTTPKPAGGSRRAEYFTIDGIDGGEVAHVRKEDRGLHDFVEARAAGLEDGAHVTHHLQEES